MSEARYLVGDVFEVLKDIPDASVDLLVSSPPFLALRSYLSDDHPDKAKEIGQEATPAEYLDTLLRLTAEWGRVLAPHGSIAVELGDTYAGGGQGPDRRHTAKESQVTYNAAKRSIHSGGGWPLDKSMCGIPHLYHLSLAYGRNLLTGEESPAGMWRVRNVVAWCRPNPPVGALGDKYRPATSYITIACKARDRWFDLDAVRTEPVFQRAGGSRVDYGTADGGEGKRDDGGEARRISNNPAGAPPLDWWEVPTEPYKGSHYATWPRRLLTRPIESMCPREVCTACGEPRRRESVAITLDSYRASTRPQTQRAVALADAAGLTNEHVAAVRAFGTSDAGKAPTVNRGAGRNSSDVKRLAAEAKQVLGGYFREFVMSTNAATSSTWSDCGCGAPWRPGIVLDPFAGSGTTLAVATGLGRDAIGIDLDERNLDLARERIGMFLRED